MNPLMKAVKKGNISPHPLCLPQRICMEIERFAKSELVNERGGFCIGRRFDVNGTSILYVDGFIPASNTKSSPVRLTFTVDTWRDIDEVMISYPGKEILGWVHTHPGYGIFLSHYDTFLHQLTFPANYHFAMVVDPCKNHAGIFQRTIDGNLSSTEYYGFYLTRIRKKDVKFPWKNL